MRFKHIYTLFLLIIFSQNILAQLSKKHFIPPLTSSDGFSDQYIYISTPKNNNVAYKITPVGNPDLTAYNGVVSNGSPVVQAVLDLLGNSDFDNDTQLHIPISLSNTKLTNRGFIIEAEDVIYVSIRVRSNRTNNGNKFHAGSLVSKGSSALGLNFRIGGFIRDAIGGNDATFASIMATEDNTTITYTGNSPFSVNLNEGESYIIAAQGEFASDIIGGLISSDKPIVVNSGSATGSFGDRTNNSDYGFDQIVGASKIGTEYILVKGNGDVVEKALIIAHEDNTEIFVNGVSVGTKNSGNYHVTNLGNYNTNGNMYINTSKPVFVYQGVGGTTSQANQGMFFVPPLSCENKGDVNNIASIDKIGSASFPGGVTIVTNKGGNVTINGKDILDPTYSTSGPFNITTSIGDYVTYKVDNLVGNVEVKSDQELYCAYFNRNGFAASGSFYSGFPSAPEVNFNTTVSTLGNCIPNVTLQAANTELFDSFRWEYFNETTNNWEFKSSIDNYKPKKTEPGRYRLIGTVDCTGAKFESIEIPVSICPDDFDGDLIIDNLDVDLDNDGILNCDESIGNATINLTDIANPSVIFQDNSSNSTIISSTYSASDVSNTFIGQSNGNFTSTLNPAASSSSEYNLNFNQKINFILTQTNDYTISDGEFFVLRIAPNNKNITLLDPDDQLLVYNTADDEFKAGVTNVSALEIRYKFKANTSEAASTFKFVANQINQITFEHKSIGTTTTSTFSGNMQLTCFALDSDGDGVEDMFDLDSDNDGVPDFYESTAQDVSLVNIDTNLDGLDDLFNTVTPNQDTDNDGVPNYLDVDADNDGIYDIEEAGYGNLDTNNDGIIDNANSSTVGLNGLLDTLETFPDSGVLNTPIRNSDSSSIVIANRDIFFDFVDLDSDGDNCFDVVEAGFTGNSSGTLIATPLEYEVNGKVKNSDGYTTPNANYITSAPIILNTPFTNITFCENDSNSIALDSNADSFQWQISTDNTTWSNIPNNTTYSGVSTTTLQITNTPLLNNNYKYRVVLNKIGNTCSFTTNEITLTVNPLPIIKPIQPLEQCISVSNTNPTVNLTIAEDNISDNIGGSFEYYEDVTGLNKITTETSYPVQVNVPKSVYVKVISKEGCNGDLVELKLNIGQTPNNPYNDIQPPVCDDYLNDIDNDSDKTTIFNLDKNAIVTSINPPSNTKVYFYENATDRTNSLDEIDITNFRNDKTKNDFTTVPGGVQFPIYYKILSTINNNCEGLGQFYVQIKSVPLANTPADFILCDDASSGTTFDGKNSGINLRDRVPVILGSTQTETDYIVSFHTSAIGANTNIDIITEDTNYTNDTQPGFSMGNINEQTIYVRVQDRNGEPKCFNDHVSFKIIVNPIPTVSTTITPFAVCDIVTPSDSDPRNRIAQNIDLTSKDTEILDGKINHRVAYYATQQDAQDGNEISTTTSFQNIKDETSFPADFNTDAPGIETIFFKVIDLGGNKCESIFSTFQLLIYPEPNIPINIADYSDCDNTSDINVDDTNGRIGTISLKNKIPEILANYDVSEYADFSITFYNSLLDAQSGNTSLALNENKFENSSNNQTIYVRVENTKNTPIACVHTRLSFNINIKPLPSFTVMGEENIDDPQIVCLNDTPLTLEAENSAATYNYVWTDQTGSVKGNERTLKVTTAGKYTVTAKDQSPDGCERKRTIVVKESNVATLNESLVTIIDESNNIGNNDNISIRIETANNILGPGNYRFAVRNDDNGERFPSIGFQDEPLFENLEGGIYTIIVNDENGCTADTELQISVIQFPKFLTPNGDGKNDTWVIKGANKTFYPNSSINIFNRFGKLVAQVPIDGQGWNGTYNGKTLPSDDYWYNVQLIPANTGTTTKLPILKKGHFSLLRK